MPLLLPRPFGGNPYPGARGQKQSKAQKEAPSSASAGPTAGKGSMGFASGFSNPAAEPPGSAGSARDAPGTWPSGVEPSAPPLPPNEVLNIDTEPMKLAEPGRFGYPSVDPWVATPTRVGSGRSSLDRPGAGPSALLTEPAAGPPISFDLNQNGALSGERKDAGGLLSKLLGLLGRGPKRAQGQKQQQQQQEQGYGQQQQQQYYGGGAGQSGRLHDVERGRRTMVQLRDLLMADASLFRVREADGEVVAVVEGDSLRLRVRGHSRSSSGSGGWGDAGAGSWGSGGGAGPAGLGKGGAEDDGVVRLEVGDVFAVDLNPPGGQLLPLLHVAPGVYTFRAPNAERSAAAAAGTEAGGVGGAAWPLPRASAHTHHRTSRHSSKQQHGSSGSSSDEGEAGNPGGDGYYYCLTVAPTICDSCSLEQLDEILASYTQYSRSTVPAAASAAAGLVHGQAITQQEHQHLAPAGPYDAAAAEAATAAGAGPAGTWPSAPTAGPAPYGTIYPEIKPYEYDKQQQQPYGFGQGQPQTYEGAIVPAAAGAAGGAAGAAAAGAAKTHQLVARLSTHAVLAARSVGETLIDGAYGAAYRIRRGADEMTRRLPPSRRNRQSAAALPLRLMVLAAWALSRTAAAAVSTVTEVLAGMGAWAAEATMLRLGRWLPLLARARRVRGALGRRGGRPGPGSGGGSGGAGSNLSMVLATVMLFIPADVFKALMGAALLAYGELHGSVEEAARVVLLAVADAAAGVAGHVGGPDASGLTRGSLEAAGYALEAATGLRKVGLRAVAREFKRRHAAALVVVPPPPAPGPPTAGRSRRDRR